MPRQVSVAAENNFIAGLITESTPLKFPPNACTESENVVFDETGRVTRRLGFDLESSYTLRVVTVETGEAWTEYVWTTAGGDGNKTLFVQQQGSTLYLYDASSSLTISDNPLTAVDLNTYTIATSALDPATLQCQYAINDGNLIVVNEATNPIYITYNPTTGFVEATVIMLKMRDFTGIEDGLDLTERLTSTVASLITANPEHYYNLLNQGWYHGSTGTGGPDTAATLAQWDTARTDVPSNADIVSIFRSSATDAFDNAVVLANSVGSTPAPKGHFILDPFQPDRTAAMADEGFTAVIGVTSAIIAPGAFATIGDMLATGNAFDDDLSESSADCATDTGSATSRYIGKNYTTSPKQISQVFIYASSNVGFYQTGDGDIDLYASQTLPANATDGTLLGTAAVTDASSSIESIVSSDMATFWNYVWVNVRSDSNTDAFVAELRFFSPTSTATVSNTVRRPTTVASFAGRVFYAGINDLGLNSTVFFSQIIQNPEQYAKCYQSNDPTSPDVSDLLPDDGGTIKIVDIGTIIKLYSYQSSLIVLASNGVWRIAGGTGAFAANDYKINKLSSIGTNSGMSVVDVKGLPVWWGEEGIYTLQYDANYDSFSVISVTDNKITSFILDIPALNRQYVKGAYDLFEDIAYWIYNSDETLASTDYYKYDRVLTFNTKSTAFSPWNVGASDPQIRGIFYIQDGAHTLPPILKFTVTIDGGASEQLSFAEAANDSYKDWTTYAGAEGDPADEIDYTSYFITGYRLDASGFRFFQSNYVWVYLEPEEDSSCFMQGIFDWTNDPNSGKWSSTQQTYNSEMNMHEVTFRKLKVRGKGRSLQLRFESESGKPFNIVGWAIWETQSAGV